MKGGANSLFDLVSGFGKIVNKEKLAALI